MATIYLRSTDGNDADDGSTWALAKATLAAAVTAAGAGGTVYMSQAHAENSASAITVTGSSASDPVKILCVNDAAAPPTALATTGSVTTTGTVVISLNGYAYCYGVKFEAGSGSTSSLPRINVNTDAGAGKWIFDSCELSTATTSPSGVIQLGATSSTGGAQGNELINTSFRFGNAGQKINTVRTLLWRNSTAVVGATVPTLLFAQMGAAQVGERILQGVDLSMLGSGCSLFAVGATTTLYRRQALIDCKLNASVSILSGSFPDDASDAEVLVINSDSGDTNYRFAAYNVLATDTHETTIVKSGGASDGTTAFARKIVTTANAVFHTPYESQWIAAWNETTGSSITATIEVVNDGVTFDNDEVWIEVEYLGTSGFPLGVYTNDRAASLLATPAAQTSSSVTWTTTGLASPVKQALAVSFTPQEKGLVRARVCVGRASTTLYYDPFVTLS